MSTVGRTVEKSEMSELMLRCGGPGRLASMMSLSFSFTSPVVSSIPFTLTTKPRPNRSGTSGRVGKSCLSSSYLTRWPAFMILLSS